jgi:hypothetical protein
MKVFNLYGAMCFMLLSCSPYEQEEWGSVTLNGRRASGFVLILNEGEVIGGHDTCNGWGLSDQPDLIVMDAQECPSDDNTEAYWALARGEGATFTQHGTKLIIKRGEHTGVFQKS